MAPALGTLWQQRRTAGQCSWSGRSGGLALLQAGCCTIVEHLQVRCLPRPSEAGQSPRAAKAPNKMACRLRRLCRLPSSPSGPSLPVASHHAAAPSRAACRRAFQAKPFRPPARPPPQLHGTQRLRLPVPRLCAALLRAHLDVAHEPSCRGAAGGPGLWLVLPVRAGRADGQCTALSYVPGRCQFCVVLRPCCWRRAAGKGRRSPRRRDSCWGLSAGRVLWLVTQPWPNRLTSLRLAPASRLARPPQVPHLLQLHPANGAAVRVLPGARLKGGRGGPLSPAHASIAPPGPCCQKAPSCLLCPAVLCPLCCRQSHFRFCIDGRRCFASQPEPHALHAKRRTLDNKVAAEAVQRGRPARWHAALPDTC